MPLPLLAALLLAAEPATPPPPAGAPPGAAAEERRKLEEQIVRELGVEPGQGAAPATAGGTAGDGGTEAPPAPPAGQGTQGGSALGRVLLLPDIAVVGRTAAVYYRRDVEVESPRDLSIVGPAGTVKPLLQEVELALQAAVDPYARADVFIAFGAEGVEVEEAFLTTLSFPVGLQLKAGRLKSPFGRHNQQHPHGWDLVDGPLALQRVLGPDGLAGDGADLAWLAPLPWFAELHLAWQEVAPGLAGGRQSTGLARLVQYLDLAEGTSLGVGLSGAWKLSGLGGSKNLAGADLYLKIRPPRGRAYVALQGEMVAHNLAAAGGGERAGGYLQALWRSSPHWAFGARYDDAPAVGGGRERRWSALAGFLPSEFQRLRLQVSQDRLPGGRDGLEVLLHLEFGIGAHGAHPF
ncbi:MAG TPA: hypothetical protein VFI16_06810 [Anaeromyxobacteraceae bacterium]|nr:hypothetical protein [Anaeromyxobacteraceae bacterium]